MLKNFLVATDGSEGAGNAARLAACMAAPRGQVMLFHVASQLGGTALAALDALNLAAGGASGNFVREWRQKHEREGAEILERARRQLARVTPPTVDIHMELETGRPASIILDRLEHGSFDVLALGSRGHGLVSRTLLGSVASEAMLYATKAILVARHDRARRILVPTDGSPASLRAAEVAGHLARELDATVSIVNAVELPMDSLGDQRDMVETSLREHFHKTLRELQHVLGVGPHTATLRFGEPVQVILDESMRQETDLIVLGRGRGPAGSLTRIGSVAYRLAMTAPASVLVVP